MCARDKGWVSAGDLWAFWREGVGLVGMGGVSRGGVLRWGFEGGCVWVGGWIDGVWGGEGCLLGDDFHKGLGE